MSAVVTVWSDLHCPWATLALARLRAARAEADLDVVFDPRPWPLEWVNERGTPRRVVEAEVAALGSHPGGDVFSAYRGDSWPSTLLPAFELVAAARRLGGVVAAEAVDFAVRRGFFKHWLDVSVRSGLRDALRETDLDAEAVLRIWEREPVRADVVEDYVRSQSLPIQGSPTIFWPDGEVSSNPGMEFELVRGIPRFTRTDPDEPGRLLREHLA